MRKEEKAEIVRELQRKVSQARIGILTDFTGLKVEAMSRLRRQLKEAGGELTVAKNTLLRRAATDDSLLALLTPHLTGPNALALGYTDPVAVARLLVKFSQESPLLAIKGGVLEGQRLTVQDINALSKLPPREVLLAQLLGTLQSIPTALVTVLSGVIRNLLNVLVAIKEQKSKAESGSAPGADAGGES